MASDQALRELASDLGIHLSYHAWSGEVQIAQPPTLKALLGAQGFDVSSAASIDELAVEMRAERSNRRLPEELVVLSESAFQVHVSGAGEFSVIDENNVEIQSGRYQDVVALADLPVGYFTLSVKDGGYQDECFILSHPPAAPSVPEVSGLEKVWGVTGPLYGLKSATNGGLGNFSDLGKAAAGLASVGAQYLGVNPVHALGWSMTQTFSPYSPSHRGFLNTDHVAAERPLAAGASHEMVDYIGFRARHRKALEKEYKAFRKQPVSSFVEFCAAQGDELANFANFEALSERFGDDFRDWPEAFQTPGTSEPEKRSEFHAWLQWRADVQLGEACRSATDAGMSLGLYLDLAVGARPGGAEAWINHETIAQGVSIGAPPDHLAPEGQNWDLAAYAPNKLKAKRYAPIRSMLAKLMAKAGLIRIDHVLGLMRSFWVPTDGSPGGYISQPFDTLLAVIAIEAHRHKCVVIGEDLGLVPDGFREKLNGFGLYSYAVWQFENYADGALRNVEELRDFSMACFGTHDTPTIAGFWRGRDIEWWHKVGWISRSKREESHAYRANQRNSLRKMCGVTPDASLERIAGAIHGELSKAPSVLTTVQLDDIFHVEEAQNLPGTINEHPNWQRIVPVAVEDFATSEDLSEIGKLMRARSQQTTNRRDSDDHREAQLQAV